MGRYQVHHFDDEDDDDDENDDNERHKLAPMDWTIIPDDDENNGELRLEHTRWDVNAAYRAFVPSPPPAIDDDFDDYGDDTDVDGRLENDYYVSDDELRQFNGRVHDDDYLEQRYLELEQHHHHAPKNKLLTRIWTILLFVVAIIAIALKKYAPPPPQTSLLTAIPPSVVIAQSDTSEATNHHDFASDFRNQKWPTHYETWGDYSRHFSSVLYHAVKYALSVAWYAISNSFHSAYEDLKVSSTELFSKYGLSNSECAESRKWRNALDKIAQSYVIGFMNWWSRIQVSAIGRGDDSHGTTSDLQQDADRNGGGLLASKISKYIFDNSTGECKWISALEKKCLQSSIIRFTNWWSQIQTTGTVTGDDFDGAMQDIQHQEDGNFDGKVSACPIRIPAASYRIAHTHRDAKIISEGIMIDTVWSTEEHLRQTIGTSLSPQNLALKIISERLDLWGNDLVETTPMALLQNMSLALVSSSHDEKGFLIDKDVVSEWILPPAFGLFIVGTAGVGKRTIAHQLAQSLLGHCRDVSRQDIIDGVLEVVMSRYDTGESFHQEERVQSLKELIVNHVHLREGLGSVVILHHIESMPPSIVSDIIQVLNGKAHAITYISLDNELVEANCNGTVFVMTSKVWGTNSIFRHLEKNGSWNVMQSRDKLISSVREQVDSYLEQFSNIISVRILLL